MEPVAQSLKFEMPPLQAITWYQCERCFDSNLLWASSQITICPNCDTRTDLPEAATKLERTVYERIAANKLITFQHFNLARALVKSTVQVPVPLYILQVHLGASDRTVKGYIEALRSDWLLPIGSSKFPPSGYYWINSAEEFKAWLDAFLSQPKEEFRTAHRMLRANFPELAGQLSINFEEEEK